MKYRSTKGAEKSQWDIDSIYLKTITHQKRKFDLNKKKLALNLNLNNTFEEERIILISGDLSPWASFDGYYKTS